MISGKPFKGKRLPGGRFALAQDYRDVTQWRPGWQGAWQTCSFEVPDDTPDERVQAKAAFYRNLAGDRIMRDAKAAHEDVTVLGLEGPFLDTRPVLEFCVEPDRKRYIIRVLVRRPIKQSKFWVPDRYAPGLEAAGFQRVG